MRKRRRSGRLLNLPQELVDRFENFHRVCVFQALMARKSEDEIYCEILGTMIEAARLEGYDEAGVEAIAAMARRNVTKILGECKAVDASGEAASYFSKALLAVCDDDEEASPPQF